MRRTTLACVLAAACAVAPADAGTGVWAATFPAENGTRSFVDSSPDGTVVAVVGGTNVVVSRDAGATWLPLGPLASPPNGGSTHTRVAVADAKRWYAFNGHRIVATTDGGATWRPVHVPNVTRPPKEPFESASAVAAADGTRTALLGWSGAEIRGLCPHPFTFTPVYTTHDGGTRWRRSDLPVVGEVDTASWYDTRRAVVVVREYEWGEPQSSEDECYVNGVGTGTSIWFTEDGGASWRLARRSNDHWATAAWTSPTSLVIIGESADAYGRAYVSADRGRTFRKPVTVYRLAGHGDTRMAGFPASGFVGQRGWVSVIGVGILRTDNGGSEWVHEPSPADGAVYGIHAFTAVDRTRAVMAGTSTILTRLGEAPAASPAAARAPWWAPRTTTTVSGAATATTTYEPDGGRTVTLRVTRED